MSTTKRRKGDRDHTNFIADRMLTVKSTTSGWEDAWMAKPRRDYSLPTPSSTGRASSSDEDVTLQTVAPRKKAVTARFKHWDPKSIRQDRQRKTRNPPPFCQPSTDQTSAAQQVLCSQLEDSDMKPTDQSTISSLSVQSAPAHRLPIEATPTAVKAISYYTRSYAPLILTRPQYAGKSTDKTLLAQLIPFVISSPLMLSGVIAHMSVIMNKSQNSINSAPNKMALRYTTEAISMLRQRLLDIASTPDDEILMAMLSLAGMEFFNRSYGRADLHMKAITRIVEMRGGTNTLGFNGYLQNTVESYQAYWRTRQSERTRKHLWGSNRAMAVYPTHPFCPELCTEIAKLPHGFQELALKELMSLPLLHMVCDIQQAQVLTRSHRKPGEKVDTSAFHTIKKNSAACVEVLGMEGLTLFERLLITGCIGVCMCTDTGGHMYRLLNPYLQCYAAGVKSLSEAMKDCVGWQKEGLMWVATVLTATTLKGSWSGKLAGMILKAVDEWKQVGEEEWDTWRARADRSKAFFWDDALEEALRERIMGGVDDSKDV